MYFADLHVHTNVSDCSMPAENILKKAKKSGITHIAFTDHDTTQCAFEHQRLAAEFGIQAIPAVEMSAYDYEGKRKVHILGYGYKTTEHIEAIGSETLRKRHENCLRQIHILNNIGYQVPVEEVQKMAGDCIYKQHILDYLLKTGQSKSLFGDIYRNIFKNGGPCDFDITYPNAAEVVEAIKKDGGKAVLAHPGQQKNFDIIPLLVQSGLDGIECNHPSNKDEDKKKVEAYAREYGLFLTGGSDFHGQYENGGAGLGEYPAHGESICLFVNN